MTQQRKEGGRGGRVGIADRCHRRRRTTRRRQEGEQGSPRSGDEDDGDSGGGRGQNDRHDRRRTHEQWCRRSDDGVAMLANGTEVARRDVDATSKRGDVRWTPLHCFIVD
mgnify:FL=1